MQVEELLTKKQVPYVISGKDVVVQCLNPEHQDNNPSMRIDRITGIFGCFSCGYSGNIFYHFNETVNFLQQKKELFKKKLHLKMAENIGLDMPKNAVFFDRDYRNISANTFKKFEAFEHSDPDFIGRLVFPIRSVSGKINAFIGRSYNPEEKKKYLITPYKAKIPVFPPRIKTIEGSIILVEGIFDMLNLYDKGLENVSCAFGTQTINKDKLILLKVQGVRNIDILFDNDKAGKDATEQVIKLCNEVELTSRVVGLPSNVKDAGELTALQVIKLKEALYG